MDVWFGLADHTLMMHIYVKVDTIGLYDYKHFNHIHTVRRRERKWKINDDAEECDVVDVAARAAAQLNKSTKKNNSSLIKREYFWDGRAILKLCAYITVRVMRAKVFFSSIIFFLVSFIYMVKVKVRIFYCVVCCASFCRCVWYNFCVCVDTAPHVTLFNFDFESLILNWSR